MEVFILQLHELTIGENAFIEKLTSLDALRERMLALGLTKGTKVEAVRKGPAGDPTIYNIRGAMIALRKEEASLIHIVKSKEPISTKVFADTIAEGGELNQIAGNDNDMEEVLDGAYIPVDTE